MIGFIRETKYAKYFYLGINLTKYIQAFYGENCNNFLKDIKQNLDKLRDKSCYWIGRFTIVNMSILHNAVQVCSKKNPNKIIHKT